MSLHVTVEDMAKKSPDKPKAGSKPEPVRKPMVVQMRGSEEWKAWIEEMADKEGFTVAMLLERAARKWAQESGFRNPPRR